MTVIENHLIRMLPARERQRILAICEPVPLILADVLCTPAKRTRYAYFPTEGFIFTSSADLAAAKRSIASGMIEATRETQCGLRAFATKAVLVRAITREGALAIASENPACERKRHFRPPALGETGTEFSTCRCVR